MAESWLEQITYVFPQNSPETVDWLATLAALLEQDPAAETVAPETVLVPRYPAGASSRPALPALPKAPVILSAAKDPNWLDHSNPSVRDGRHGGARAGV